MNNLFSPPSPVSSLDHPISFQVYLDSAPSQDPYNQKFTFDHSRVGHNIPSHAINHPFLITLAFPSFFSPTSSLFTPAPHLSSQKLSRGAGLDRSPSIYHFSSIYFKILALTTHLQSRPSQPLLHTLQEGPEMWVVGNSVSFGAMVAEF